MHFIYQTNSRNIGDVPPSPASSTSTTPPPPSPTPSASIVASAAPHRAHFAVRAAIVRPKRGGIIRPQQQVSNSSSPGHLSFWCTHSNFCVLHIYLYIFRICSVAIKWVKYARTASQRAMLHLCSRTRAHKTRVGNVAPLGAASQKKTCRDTTMPLGTCVVRRPRGALCCGPCVSCQSIIWCGRCAQAIESGFHCVRRARCALVRCEMSICRCVCYAHTSCAHAIFAATRNAHAIHDVCCYLSERTVNAVRRLGVGSIVLSGTKTCV